MRRRRSSVAIIQALAGGNSFNRVRQQLVSTLIEAQLLANSRVSASGASATRVHASQRRQLSEANSHFPLIMMNEQLLLNGAE